MSKVSEIFVVGATGAQGIPVVRGLVKTKLTLSALSLEMLFPYLDCDGAFINIDGFNSGEKTEMFWAIRGYELALEEGIKFFVYGNLDFVYKKSNYNPIFRTGHYDGKGRIGEWILQQNVHNGTRMGAALFTTGPYIEMCIARATPMSPVIENGVVVWKVPLGEGAVVHVALDDCEYYVRWLFDHPERANEMDLEVAIDHIKYAGLAKAFETVARKKARFVDVSREEYWKTGPISRGSDLVSGYNSDLKDAAAVTVKENFTGFWNLWKYSGGNEGVVTRDYKLLDEIHPKPIKTAEEWFRREDTKGREAGLGGL